MHLTPSRLSDNEWFQVPFHSLSHGCKDLSLLVSSGTREVGPRGHLLPDHLVKSQKTSKTVVCHVSEPTIIIV